MTFFGGVFGSSGAVGSSGEVEVDETVVFAVEHAEDLEAMVSLLGEALE